MKSLRTLLIDAATDLPVSADLEDGFGAAPETCAETIRLSCEIGLVRGAIEGATDDPNAPIFDIGVSVTRIQAAADAAHDKPFILTARAENYFWGRPNL
jgi:2-methylisocitrate lyase-like PEP mutase family enzyme